MADFCQPCRKEGRLTVAVYKAHPEDEVPSLCFNCNNGKGHSMVALGAPEEERPQPRAAVPHEHGNGGSMEEKICGREGCGKQLTEKNRSGFCPKHFYDSKRKTQRADGMKKYREAAANRMSAPGPLHDFEKPLTVKVNVTSEFCDRIWNGMSLQEKANLIFGEGR